MNKDKKELVKFSTYSFSMGIAKVEITRETDLTIWVSGSNRGTRKRSSYLNYWDTWEDAKAYLIGRQQSEIDYHDARKRNAIAKLAEIKKMKPND